MDEYTKEISVLISRSALWLGGIEAANRLAERIMDEVTGTPMKIITDLQAQNSKLREGFKELITDIGHDLGTAEGFMSIERDPCKKEYWRGRVRSSEMAIIRAKALLKETEKP